MPKQNQAETIRKAVELFNALQGKTWSTKEINELATQHNVRHGLQRFAYERGWCSRVGESQKLWEFPRFEYHPNHLRLVLEDSLEYNRSLKSKDKFDKKIAKKEKAIKEKLPSVVEVKEVVIRHNGEEHSLPITQETIIELFQKGAMVLENSQEMEKQRNEWKNQFLTLEEIHQRNLCELSDLDGKCIEYLDLIDDYKKRVEELEVEREKVRKMLYKNLLIEFDKSVSVED